MCLIACDVCHCDLSGGDSPRSARYGIKCCAKCEHAYEHYQALEERLFAAEQRSNRYHEAMTEVIALAAEQLKSDADAINLPRGLLMELARTLDHRGNIERFLDQQYSRVWIAAAAANVFGSKPRKPLAERLEWLREASFAHGKSLGDDDRDGLTVTQLLDEARSTHA